MRSVMPATWNSGLPVSFSLRRYFARISDSRTEWRNGADSSTAGDSASSPSSPAATMKSSSSSSSATMSSTDDSDTGDRVICLVKHLRFWIEK